MAIRSDYTAGTVTVSAGGTVVTGVGTGWLAAEFQEGDVFIADGWYCVIASVDSNTQITLYEDGGTRGGALAGAEYRLRYMSNGSRVSAQARELIDMLGASGNLQALGGLNGSNGTVPVFTGPGTMETRPYASGLVPRGDWDADTVYTSGDLATFDGNVFTSITDNNEGNEPPSSQTTDANWMYIPVAPGPKGDTGDEGPAGPANSLSIGTVEGGDTADASITGTAPSQTLNLTLPKGDTGGAGWTPVFAVVADGARYVQQVVDWVGGTGTKPSTGEYVGASGFVTAIGGAVNIRGASGSGTGDVVGPNVSTDGNLAVFDGITGKMIRDGGAPFSGSYDDLTDKPSFVTSVALTVPTGLTVAGSPITTSGTLEVTYSSGYQGYTTTEASKLSGIESGAQVNTVTSVASKTGAVTLDKNDVGLDEVDNTSDAEKPVSTAQQTAIDLKVTKANDTGLGGFTLSSKNLGNLTGTVVLSPVGGNMQHAQNNAAATISVPVVAGSYTIILQLTNSATAGAITMSGFTKVGGDALTTTNGHKFLLYITKADTWSSLNVEALQ